MAPAASPAPAPARNSYTPAHLIERALNTRSALVGERKQVSVLFCDIRNSTRLAQQLGAEAWHATLDVFFRHAAHCVHSHEGTINQFTGDGIMALFGAPLAIELHAPQACRAALALQSVSDHLDSAGPSLELRVGIHSGEVVVGSIGDDLRLDYTAQGSVVMLAKRLEAAAPVGQVLISRQTARLVEGYLDVIDHPPLVAKGFDEPVAVALLGAAGPSRTRLEAARRRGLSPLVGRDSELHQLRAALTRAEAGQGRAAGLVGPPGIGKSRLADALGEEAEGRGFALYRLQCAPAARSIPLYAMRLLTRMLLELTDTVERTEQAVEAAVRQRGLAHDHLPAALDLVDENHPPASAARVVRDRAHDALLLGLLQQRPGATLLLLDDLQWMDAESLRLLLTLVGNADRHRLLILITYRPEFQDRELRSAGCVRLEVPALGDHDSRSLVQALIGTDSSVAGLTERLLEHTAGVPFFLEEAIRELVETGILKASGGALVQHGQDVAFSIPATVEAVIAARVDRLPAAAKAALQCGSVLGQEFTLETLRQLIDVEPETITRLCRGRFLVERNASHQFEHALTREVVYESILTPQRQALHRAAALAIEQEGQGGVEQSARLAAQWEAAGDALRAARWHNRVARLSGFTYPVRATEHSRQVLRLLEDDDSTEGLRLRVYAFMLLLINGVVHEGLDRQELVKMYEQARTLTSKIDQPRMSSHLELAQGVGMLVLGAGAAAARHFQAAADALRRGGDEAGALNIELGEPMATAEYFLGEVSSAIDRLERGRELPGTDDDAGRMRIEALLRTCAGQFDRAVQLFDAAIARAEATGDIYLARHTHCNWGHLAWMLGDGDRGRWHASEALRLAEEEGSSFYVAEADLTLVLALVGGADWLTARRELSRIIALPARERTSEGLSLLNALLAEVLLELGDREQALKLAEAAIAAAQSATRRRSEVQALILLVRAAEPARARAAQAQAERLISRYGMEAYQPFLLLARAERAHDSAAADGLRKSAIDLFERFGAPLRAQRILTGAES